MGNPSVVTRVKEGATTLPLEVQAAYNAANEQIQFNSATPNFIYDANGNLVTRVDVAGSTTYTWDTRNRLVGINGPGLSASFQYDPVGRRVSKTVNGSRTSYHYDGKNIIAESIEGAVKARYLNSLSIDEKFIRQSNEIAYYHVDAIGSILALTNKNGTVMTTYAYDPFGNTTITGLNSNTFQYTGRQNDETGLYYYRARYYSPQFRRFLGEAPILVPHFPLSVGSSSRINKIQWLLSEQVATLASETSQSLNAFVYANNNPVRFVDRLGLKPCETSPIERDCRDKFQNIAGNEMRNSRGAPSNTLAQCAHVGFSTFGFGLGTGCTSPSCLSANLDRLVKNCSSNPAPGGGENLLKECQRRIKKCLNQ